MIKNEQQMKINPNYKLRSIAGETIVVNQGISGTDMTRIISLCSRCSGTERMW